MRWLAGAVVAIMVGALGWPEGTPPVCADCRHTCDAGETHDARGCCHKRTKISKRKVRKKKKGKKKGATVVGTGGPDLTAGAGPAVVTTGDKPRHHKSVADLASGCQNGDAGDCGDFALVYDGATPELDDSTVASMFTTGCDAGHVRACARLGTQYENGKGVQQDFDKAQALYEKACNKNDPIGCHSLGRIYYLALGVVKDVDRAIKLFKRACDAGITASCSDVGYAYENALGDYVSAAQWYMSACDQDDAVGCANAAALFSQAGDDDKARDLRARACALGNADSC